MTKTEMAVIEKRTLFSKNVKNPMENKADILKPGSNNKKLGGFISKGIWRGLPMFSLTLEERATCPTSCAHYKDCYGNNMRFAHRYKSGDDLENRLEIELTKLNYIHKFGFVVRLHVLGDFYNVNYVQKWEKWLKKFPNMKIFGYTGYKPDDKIQKYAEIGLEILRVRLQNPRRFQIRISDGGDVEFSANPIDEGFKGFTCPEQTGKVPTCSDCGLCWTTNKNVNFITH